MRDGLWGMIYFPLFLHLKSILIANQNSSQFPSNVKSNEFVMNMIASSGAAGSATLLSSFLDSVRLFQQKTHDPEKGTSLLKALKMSLIPNKRNVASVLTGVGRVTITTCFGHLTFIAISQAAENR